MKKRPGYWTASSNSTWFSGIWIVPRSRLGSKLHAVVRALWSRSSGAVTGWMKTSRLPSRCAFAQSVRAVRSYSSLTDASPPAGSLPCGVPVIQPKPGRTPTCDSASACEVVPSITPLQKAASFRPASRLAMLLGRSDDDDVDIGTPSTLFPAWYILTATRCPVVPGFAAIASLHRLQVRHQLCRSSSPRASPRRGHRRSRGRRGRCRRTHRRSGCSGRTASDSCSAAGSRVAIGACGDRVLAAELVGLRARAVRAEGDRVRVRDAGGAAGSGTGLPLTGFSGTGGLNVVAEARRVGQTAGPGVGKVTAPVRRPHQLFCAWTGTAVLFATAVGRGVQHAEGVVDDVAAADRGRRRADEPHAGAQPEVGVVLGVVAERERIVVRSGREDARDRRALAVHEVRRDRVVVHLDRRAGCHAHAVLTEERPRRRAAAAAGSGSSRPMPGSCRRSRSVARRRSGRCSSGRSCGRRSGRL